MFFKDNMTLLAECAVADLGRNTETLVKESRIISSYDAIEEAAEEIVYAAEMVPVTRVGNDLLTEMQYIAPYMQNNEITSVAEALNNIARANGLPDKSVGLLVESQECVTRMISEALKKGKSTGDAMLAKVKKGESLIDKLKTKGFTVKKKKSASTKKPKSVKNEEGTNTGSQAPGENISDTRADGQDNPVSNTALGV